MSTATNQYIRIPKTPEVIEMVNDFKSFYKGLTELEIFKVVFSQHWREKFGVDENGFTSVQRKSLDEAIAEADRGEGLIGPFDNIEDFLSDLKK